MPVDYRILILQHGARVQATTTEKLGCTLETTTFSFFCKCGFHSSETLINLTAGLPRTLQVIFFTLAIIDLCDSFFFFQEDSGLKICFFSKISNRKRKKLLQTSCDVLPLLVNKREQQTWCPLESPRLEIVKEWRKKKKKKVKWRWTPLAFLSSNVPENFSRST